MQLFGISHTRERYIIKFFGIKISFRHNNPIFVENGNELIIDKKIKKKKLYIDIQGENNKVIIGNVNVTNKLNIAMYGKNNRIIIGDINITNKLDISMYGENSTIIFNDGIYINNCSVILGANNCHAGLCKNSSIKIENNVSIEQATIATYESNTNIKIGEDCMLACGILIMNSDCHPIFNKSSGEIINNAKDLYIGEHCWIGQNSTILKNVSLPKNTIVGCGAVVINSSSFEENSIVAGIPAKTIKTNITWDKDGSGKYIENQTVGVANG